MRSEARANLLSSGKKNSKLLKSGRRPQDRRVMVTKRRKGSRAAWTCRDADVKSSCLSLLIEIVRPGLGAFCKRMITLAIELAFDGECWISGSTSLFAAHAA